MSMTTPEVIDRLRRTFAPPQFGHIVEFERIDFLAVGAWKSLRYDVTGCEVKVSRADWRKELAKLDRKGKGEHGRQFCDFWCVAAPAGLIDPAELADVDQGRWGLLEVAARGCRTTRKPQRLRPRWDGKGTPLFPTPEYLARYSFAMAARRWAYSDADRRAVRDLALDRLDLVEVTKALDVAAISTGRLTSHERHANAEYARESREQTRSWRQHVAHQDDRPVDGCDWCAVLTLPSRRREASA